MDNLSQIGWLENINIDSEVVVFLFSLPLVITLLSFAKYVLGIKSLGIYVPVILTYMFYHLSSLGGSFSISQGLQFGLFRSFIVFLGSYLSYKFIQQLALQYYSKLAIVTTTVTLLLILILTILDLLQMDSILNIDMFSLVLLVSIAERFTNIHASNQAKGAFIISIQTILLGIISFLIISSPFVINLFGNYPWIILFLFPINYLIGRFSGLRLTEFYRFKDLLDKEQDS